MSRFSLSLRKLDVPPRNPGRGFVNMYFNGEGQLCFQSDDGRTVKVDTAAYDFTTAAPATPTSTGVKGDIRVPGDSFMYICYLKNKWGRIPFATSWSN
jgi:hypothetical protein